MVALLVAMPAAAAVADDPDQPPQVFNTDVSPRALPSTGGIVTIQGDATDDVELLQVYADVIGSDGSSLVVPMTLQSGITYAGPGVLPPNPGFTPITYTVTVWAQDNFLIYGGDPAGEVTVAPRLSAGLLTTSPKKVSFGDVRAGSVRSKAVVIKNEGRRQDAPIVFAVTTTGLFGVIGPDHFTLSPGQKALVVVAFRPTAAGDQRGSLVIQRADGGQPNLAVPLQGRGVRR
jgi:hypothetical protein